MQTPIPLPSRPPCPAAGRPRPRRGFTLVELMITLAVLVVLMAVAVPSMRDFSANNQLVATKSAFAAAVALARTEAAKRGRMVVVQALGSGAAGNEYANGWEIGIDDDGNGVLAAGETRVRRHAAPLESIRLGGAASVAFRASGALAGTAAQVFTLCRSGGASRGYTVTVTPSGATDVAAIDSCAA